MRERKNKTTKPKQPYNHRGRSERENFFKTRKGKREEVMNQQHQENSSESGRFTAGGAGKKRDNNSSPAGYTGDTSSQRKKKERNRTVKLKRSIIPFKRLGTKELWGKSRCISQEEKREKVQVQKQGR